MMKVSFHQYCNLAQKCTSLWYRLCRLTGTYHRIHIWYFQSIELNCLSNFTSRLSVRCSITNRKIKYFVSLRSLFISFTRMGCFLSTISAKDGIQYGCDNDINQIWGSWISIFIDWNIRFREIVCYLIGSNESNHQ